MELEVRTEVIHTHYEGVTLEEALVIAEMLREQMKNGGYSIGSMRREVEDSLDLDDDLIETIVWTE